MSGAIQFDLLPALAAIDSFWIFVAFVVISAISSWLKKKGEQQEEDSWTSDDDAFSRPSPGERGTSAAPQKISNWEEELKRVLEGQIPSSAPPPAPPPIVIVEQKPPPPLPNPAQASPAPVLARVRIDEEAEGESEGAGGRLATLSESAAAHERVSQLQALAMQRLQRADEQTARATPAAPNLRRSAPAPDLQAIRQMFRNPATARQAVIASFVLGPSKAMEA